ncbi:ATP-binding protein [Flavobacterium sp. K5-23]|uniref:tetratricopeptide repeat-containing sensor histidine kinase n=1 Tax=Flavobacterium sp. K5-23 TaxID=2746225 RepID=UPI00200E9D55|nr:ATP-binding protein [Flavobacterium sp. K5-23]UQD56544.1 two-component sensor histidine kinase [Flavobacterium sp. K5-23]
MVRNQIILILFLFVSTFNYPLFAKETNPTIAEIKKASDEAVMLMKENKFEKSLIKSRYALQQAIVLKNDNLIATCYNTIAANFDGLSEYEKAFYYYKKGLSYANKTNNNELKNWLYNNLGNIYCFDKKEYATGIAYYKKSLEYSSKIGDSTQIVFTNLNISWAYFDIGSFKKGLPYLQLVNKYHNKFGDKSTIVALNMLNGMYYGHLSNIPKASMYFEKAIQLGNKGEEKSDLSLAHQEYSNFLIKNKSYKKAYENLALYNSITAVINNEEKLKKANVAGINLQLDEYKREIDNMETKYKTDQQLLINKQNKNIQVSVIIISSLLLLLILSYFFYQNTSLKQKNKLKDVQSKIQQNIINASINGQETERKKIASFLHDNISALLSTAGLHLSVATSKNNHLSEEIIKTKAILEEAHDKVRDLSHELLPSLLARFGLFYALQDLCEKNSNSVIHFEYSSSLATKTRFNEEFEMKMYFIITELLNNIIKHSQAKIAKVNLHEEDNQLIIHIYDNGKGFDSKNFDVIEGFGLNQIRARISNMNGEFSIQSKLDTETSIKIKVPILQTA